MTRPRSSGVRQGFERCPRLFDSVIMGLPCGSRLFDRRITRSFLVRCCSARCRFAVLRHCMFGIVFASVISSGRVKRGRQLLLGPSCPASGTRYLSGWALIVSA